MGGGGHGHEEPFKVPDHRIYDKWRQFPALDQHARRLEQMGLRDPWIRNVSFNWDPRYGWGVGYVRRYMRIMFSGFWYGAAAAVGLILLDKFIFVPHANDHILHGEHTNERPKGHLH